MHNLQQISQIEEYRIPTSITTDQNKVEQYWSVFRRVSGSNRSNLTTIPRLPPAISAEQSVKPAALCHLNARSVKNKSIIIKDLVVDNNIDILAITETWLQPDISNQIIVNNICPTRFILHHLPRAAHKGGGVALLYKNRFRLKKLSLDISSNSFEFTDCMISYLSSRLQTVVVYRPPPSKKNQLNVTMFLEEFSSFHEKLVTTNAPLVIVGDFHFHLDNENDQSAA